MTEPKKEPTQAAEGRKTRRRYSLEQRIALLEEADQPGQGIALVARKHGIAPSVMFKWRQLRERGAVTGLQTDEELVPASEMRAARAEIREQQRLLGKKTEEAEILQEAPEIARDRRLISRLPSLPRGGGR